MEDQQTEYTVYLHTLIGDVMERIKTFYCREDLRVKVQEVVQQYEKKLSGYTFRLKELNEMCDACGLDADALCDPQTMEAELAKVPARKELRKKLLMELQRICTEFPTSSDYIRRLVWRLEPRHGNDPVRLTIARRFVAETEYHTEPVIDYVTQTLNAEEKQLCQGLSDAQKRHFFAQKLDDGIFGELHRSGAELTPDRTLQLLSRQQRLDAAGDFRFSAQVLQRASELLGAPAPENTARLLSALAGRADGTLADAMEQEFCAFLKPSGKDKTYKQAKKDQKKALKTDWTLLRLADDLATGKFRVNGITREQLYIFAMAFDLRYYPDCSAPDYDPSRDLVKHLFRDYYHDNLLRYVLDEEYLQNRSSYDAEPTGEGINFKNYVEVIYLYYLAAGNRLSALEKLKKAQSLIDQCAKKAKKHTHRITAAPAQRTQVFRENFLQEMLEIRDEEELADYICTHYYIYNSAYSGVRMMYSAEQNTARALYRELTGIFLKEYPECFGTLNDHVELNNGIGLEALLQQLEDENRGDPAFLAMLRRDSPFVALLRQLDEKLQTRKTQIFKLYNDPDAAANHTYTRTEMISLYYCYFLNVLQELVEDFGILDLPQLYQEFCEGDGIRPGINDYLNECRYQCISEKNPFDMFVIFAVFLELIRWDET